MLKVSNCLNNLICRVIAYFKSVDLISYYNCLGAFLMAGSVSQNL